jgi:RimJ/RimL family protein N-acetyltransferase
MRAAGAVVLETQRLVLRRWRQEDAAALAALNADREVVRFVGAGTPLHRAASDALLARFDQEWEARGYGPLAVAAREEPTTLLGFCGLMAPAFLPTVLPAAEIGWRFARPAWGRGLATESARAVLDVAFGPLGLAEVLAIVAPGNVRSLRVCAKLGMTPRPDRWHPSSRFRVRVLAATTLDHDASRGRQASTWSEPPGWSRAEVPEAS